MSLTKDYTTKLRMALDRSLPAEARAFAVCECVAAQHLGAIQVLGYILGALASGLLLLARF